MIDFRHLTFLALCDTRHYSKVAAQLHMTQPAVTQHIQYLETLYHCKLFAYEGKQLKLTEKGVFLEKHLKRLHADSALTVRLMHQERGQMQLAFGATLTIGEYVLPRVLQSFMAENPQYRIKMMVENTQTLLDKIDNGALAFAFIEGYFDKSRYACLPFSEEPFVGICHQSSPYANGLYALEDLFEETLLIREEGSGTREIFERVLYEENYSIQAFAQVVEIGNLGAIQTLVSEGEGIAFMYKVAAEVLLKQNKLAIIQLKGKPIVKSFHFVYLKDSIHEAQYLDWYRKMK